MIEDCHNFAVCLVRLWVALRPLNHGICGKNVASEMNSLKRRIHPERFFPAIALSSYTKEKGEVDGVHYDGLRAIISTRWLSESAKHPDDIERTTALAIANANTRYS